MDYRNLGRSGLKVSTVGLGCNNFGWTIDLEQSRAVIDAAIDAGITFFDTANVYGNGGGSEEIMGQVLGERRKDIVLATKAGLKMPDGSKGGSRANIVRAFDESLIRLKTDYIDFYQFHWSDPETPIDETLRAMDDLMRAGKVRYIGCCNLAAWEMVEAEYIARELGTNRFIGTQAELSLLRRDNETALIPALEAYGIGFLPYFPLASGLLTGKYKRDAIPEGSRFDKLEGMAGRYLTEENWDKTEKLMAFCEARGRTLVELAFSWLLTRPMVASVMAGATKPSQIEANVAATGWALSEDELAEIDTITGVV
ncbi:aldo/keto reductase [Maritimibacter sp. UBA3975]|uniref:aldo/keto reductase n=1 Tax=Maritimibacter sp. UBA3975 TaxID=1946833 RepID=UPI000C09ECA7|nr:aldo/keto reductase [Maritimibacter sp. UBA3975]MAM61313.1 aldo/keto reductase [Maritimibacter sp.]|tara:strand:- start:3840 stop:4775 length:936 start_codon:yes stop_codon:yes gene_type:complete